MPAKKYLQSKRKAFQRYIPASLLRFNGPPELSRLRGRVSPQVLHHDHRGHHSQDGTGHLADEAAADGAGEDDGGPCGVPRERLLHLDDAGALLGGPGARAVVAPPQLEGEAAHLGAKKNTPNTKTEAGHG